MEGGKAEGGYTMVVKVNRRYQEVLQLEQRYGILAIPLYGLGRIPWQDWGGTANGAEKGKGVGTEQGT